MIELIAEPFSYGYMVKAMLVCAIVCGTCAFLSCFVTLKRWSLMGDALSHAVVPGVVVASIIGAPFAVGAFLSGIFASLAMGVVKAKTALREDAVIGIVFTAFFALGLFLISIYPSNISLKTIVLGNTLGISDSDIIQVVIIAAATLLILGTRWRDLVLFCFDQNHASALGINTVVLHYTLLALLSATAVASLQAVGACLVVATLVTPGATAFLLTDRFGVMIWISIAIGLLTGFLGAYFSYFLDGSTGGCIVVLQTAIFIAALVFAPKHGLLAQRALRGKSHTTEESYGLA